MAFDNSTFIGRVSEATAQIFSKVLVALIIAVMGLIMGRILGKVIQKVLSEIEIDRAIKKLTGISLKFEEFIGIAVSFGIYFISILWALQMLGLGSIIVNSIAGVGMIVIIIALILGLKDFIPNLFAGFYIHLRGNIKSGEHIKIVSETTRVSGVIKDISLTETIMETDLKDTVVIPNSIFLREKIIKSNKKQK